MIKKKHENILECPVRRSLELVGGKWKLLLIDCCRESPQRYGALRRQVPDISEKMLIQELKSLVDNGLLGKTSYPEVPPRVEYYLTGKGIRALPIIDLLQQFGKENMPG